MRKILSGAAAVAALLILGDGRLATAQDSPDNRLSVAEGKLAALEHQVRLLEDVEAIKRLQQAYGYYRNAGMADAVADLFADHAGVSVEIGGDGAYIGRDRIRAYFTRKAAAAGEGVLDNRYIVQGVVHVAPDGRTARGRWRAIIQKGTHGEDGVWGEGPYENRYVKEDGVWKFSAVRRFTTVLGSYDRGWHKGPLPLPGPDAGLPPDRAPAQTVTYPAMTFMPYHYNHPVTGKPVRAD